MIRGYEISGLISGAIRVFLAAMAIHAVFAIFVCTPASLRKDKRKAALCAAGGILLFGAVVGLLSVFVLMVATLFTLREILIGFGSVEAIMLALALITGRKRIKAFIEEESRAIEQDREAKRFLEEIRIRCGLKKKTPIETLKSAIKNME